MNANLDKYDFHILEVLSSNGRISITQLAEQIGLSKTPCQNRVKRLENSGYICGYRAILNLDKLDQGHIAFVQVHLEDTRSVALEAFNRAIANIDEIEQCHMIAGGFDYLLKVRSRDIANYRKILGETITSLPHVASTSTFVSMETIKE